MSVNLSASGARLSRTGTILSGDFTVRCFARIDTDTGDYHMPIMLGSSAAMTSDMVELGVTDADRWYHATNTDGTIRDTYAIGGANADVTYGAWWTLFLRRTGSSLSAWVAPLGSAVQEITAYGSAYSGAITELRISDSPFGAQYRFRGDLAGLCLWTSSLSESDMNAERLAIAPVRTSDLWGYWPLTDAASAATDASGNGRDLTSAGTITTDTAPFGLTMAADVGSFALTGQAANLRASRIVVAAQGTIALTGQDAAFKRAIRMPSDVGSFALTGQAAALQRGGSIVTDAGSFGLDGHDVPFRRSLVASASVASFVATGQDVGFALSRRLAADVGSIALTGQPVGLFRGVQPLAADVGSIALTGQDVTFKRSLVFAAGAGGFALTGQDARLLHGHRLSAEHATIAMLGQAVEILYKRVQAERGSFELTGFAANLTKTSILPIMAMKILLVDVHLATIGTARAGSLYDESKDATTIAQLRAAGGSLVDAALFDPSFVEMLQQPRRSEDSQYLILGQLVAMLTEEVFA